MAGGRDGKKEYSRRRPPQDLPRNYNIHELEEDRAFRGSAYYIDKYAYDTQTEDERRGDRRDDRRDKRYIAVE